MRISDWSSYVCSSESSGGSRELFRRGALWERLQPRDFSGRSHTPPSPGEARMTTRKHIAALAICLLATACTGKAPPHEADTNTTPTPAPQRAGRSEEYTSDLKSLMRISYADLCLQ